jgi:ribosomal protein L7/L12
MFDYLPALLIIAVAVGAYQLAKFHERLQNSEAKLDALLRHFGIEWGTLAEPSDRVKELARDPKSRIEAIKAYRQQTGVGLKEAKKVVESIS